MKNITRFTVTANIGNTVDQSSKLLMLQNNVTYKCIDCIHWYPGKRVAHRLQIDIPAKEWWLEDSNSRGSLDYQDEDQLEHHQSKEIKKEKLVRNSHTPYSNKEDKVENVCNRYSLQNAGGPTRSCCWPSVPSPWQVVQRMGKIHCKELCMPCTGFEVIFLTF